MDLKIRSKFPWYDGFHLSPVGMPHVYFLYLLLINDFKWDMQAEGNSNIVKIDIVIFHKYPQVSTN